MEIVNRALEVGHSVTAFVRSPEKLLKRFGGRIDVMKGDLLDADELGQAIRGHDAVLSGFGPSVPVRKGDEDVVTRFTSALTKAMKDCGVRRVVVESVAFLFKDALMPPAYFLGRLLFPQIVKDWEVAENLLQDSALDWTIVRPPRLTDKPQTGKYRFREGHLPSFAFSISRADVADFMVRSLENGVYVRKIVGVCD
jgi:putative NADH-flavin reductase